MANTGDIVVAKRMGHLHRAAFHELYGGNNMTKVLGGIFFVVAYLAMGAKPSIGHPIAQVPMHNFDLKQDVAIMLTCKGNCYRNYQACLKTATNYISQAYCTDTYNWCTSHCKVTYEGTSIIPNTFGGIPSGSTKPAPTGRPVGGGSKSGSQ